MFFNFRAPAPIISTNVITLSAHPLGKFLAFTLPITAYRLPRWLGGYEFSMNPGPWNIKEHALVYMMANVAANAPYAINAVVVAEIDYGERMSYWFSVVLVMATQLTGFGLAGLCRRVLVWPASMLWPQNLVTCTVLNTLHAEEDEDRGGGCHEHPLQHPSTQFAAVQEVRASSDIPLKLMSSYYISGMC